MVTPPRLFRETPQTQVAALHSGAGGWTLYTGPHPKSKSPLDLHDSNMEIQLPEGHPLGLSE